MSDYGDSLDDFSGSASEDDEILSKGKCSSFHNKWKRDFSPESATWLFGNKKINIRTVQTYQIRSPISDCSRPKTFKFATTTILKKEELLATTKPITLNMFQWFTEKYKTIINVGGPIWALAWGCTKKTKSLLAVYTHVDQYHVTKISDTSCHPGVIQLWQIRHNFKNPALKELFYTDYAPIYDMQWVPTDFGSKLLPSFLFGLLAFCGSDHIVRIAIIHTPSKNDKHDIETCRTMQIIFNLIPGRGNQEKLKELYGKATCFRFSPVSPHNLVTVGYGNGYTCVYNLQNDVQIDNTENPLKYDIYPSMRKPCFSSSVSSVEFCPFIPNLILVGGAEPKIMIFDLHSPSDRPASYDAIASKIRWPVFSWEPIFSETYNYYYSGRGLRRLRLFSDPIEVTQVGNKCLVTSKKDYPIMDMDICDIYGYQASSTFNGCVYIYNYNQPRLKKLYKKYREKLAYKLEISDEDQGDLTDLKMLNEKDTTPNSENEDLDNSISSKVWSRSIESTNKRFEGMTLTYIEYRIKKLRPKTKPVPLHSTGEVMDETLVLNPLSINKVAINSNVFGCSILASGGNAGLLRIDDMVTSFR